MWGLSCDMINVYRSTFTDQRLQINFYRSTFTDQRSQQNEPAPIHIPSTTTPHTHTRHIHMPSTTTSERLQTEHLLAIPCHVTASHLCACALRCNLKFGATGVCPAVFLAVYGTDHYTEPNTRCILPHLQPTGANMQRFVRNTSTLRRCTWRRRMEGAKCARV